MNTLLVARPPSDVFAVLADGWTYSNWVVGTSHMRAVEAGWPGAGTRLFHAAGTWPLVRRDETVVDACEPDRRLALIAKGRPFAEASVVIELSEEAGVCRVTMTETPIAGAARWLHNPALDALLARRNSESLARLRSIAERRTTPDESA